MTTENKERVSISIDIQKGAYEWFSRIASNNCKNLGEWMENRIIHDLNQSLYKDLTGYEYDELEAELNRRIKGEEGEAHPTLVYSSYIGEWHRRRLKEELRREKNLYESGEPRFRFSDAYHLISKYLSYIEAEEENWEIKMSAPLTARAVRKPDEDKELE